MPSTRCLMAVQYAARPGALGKRQPSPTMASGRKGELSVGFKPNSNLVSGHFKHDAAGYFITDERMMTSMPGLFAAGDVRSQLTRQITTAVGDATTAAIAVEKYLAALREKEKAAVAR